jgi:hypothetical protein
VFAAILIVMLHIFIVILAFFNGVFGKIPLIATVIWLHFGIQARKNSPMFKYVWFTIGVFLAFIFLFWVGVANI